jgi:phage tail sheath protein FI
VPRPGTDILIVDEAAGGGPVLDTGQAFFVGSSERGPTDRAELVSSSREYDLRYGPRSGGSLLSDAVSAYFAEGGGVLYVSRAIGTGSTPATAAFGSATANAASPGTWGNNVTVKAEAPASLLERLRASNPLVAGDPVVVTVAYQDVVLERSPTLAGVDALVTWAEEFSQLVRFVPGADNVLPAAATSVDLAGGTNGAAVDDTTIGAALARFDSAYGPGQVCAPGLSSTSVHELLCAHAEQTKRVALLDLPDSPDPLVLGAAVQALYGTDGVRLTAAFAPWAVYPGPAGSQVVVPYSAVEAGLIAQADLATGNPNQPAAGANGVSRYALGLSQEFTDDEREALNDTGVSMAKVIYGDVRTYGYRTAAGPDDTNWQWFGNSRVIMAIAHESDAVAENYVLRQIDGRKQLFAALEADLRGVCLRYFNAGALYGEDPPDAFQVDTGDQVNTIDSIKRGEVHAVVRVKCSPAAEWVVIQIVKVPVERPLPAAA